MSSGSCCPSASIVTMSALRIPRFNGERVEWRKWKRRALGILNGVDDVCEVLTMEGKLKEGNVEEKKRR